MSINGTEVTDDTTDKGTTAKNLVSRRIILTAGLAAGALALSGCKQENGQERRIRIERENDGDEVIEALNSGSKVIHSYQQFVMDRVDSKPKLGNVLVVSKKKRDGNYLRIYPTDINFYEKSDFELDSEGKVKIVKGKIVLGDKLVSPSAFNLVEDDSLENLTEINNTYSELMKYYNKGGRFLLGDEIVDNTNSFLLVSKGVPIIFPKNEIEYDNKGTHLFHDYSGHRRNHYYELRVNGKFHGHFNDYSEVERNGVPRTSNGWSSITTHGMHITDLEKM